ncbi:MAG: hypothetical protein WCF84_01310, partial [Anaerolineae bacterium]
LTPHHHDADNLIQLVPRLMQLTGDERLLELGFGNGRLMPNSKRMDSRSSERIASWTPKWKRTVRKSSLNRFA